MNFANQWKARAGIVMYAVGIAIGLLLAIFLAWADFEASFFDSSLAADTEMQAFACPLAITTNEEAQITLQIENPSEREVRTILRLTQTDGSIIAVKRLEERLLFSPNETLTFSWPVKASDAAWGRFVMTRVYMIGSSPLPSMAEYCGILVINFPFLTGHQVLGVLVVLFLGLVIFGGQMWINNTEQSAMESNRNARLLTAYVIFVGITLVVAFFSGWGLTAPLLVVNVVLAMVVLAYRVTHAS